MFLSLVGADEAVVGGPGCLLYGCKVAIFHVITVDSLRAMCNKSLQVPSSLCLLLYFADSHQCR